MSDQWISRRVAAVKAADAINAIEGAPVSDYAKNLSYLWAKGDLSGDQMRDALLISHRAIAQRLRDHG